MRRSLFVLATLAMSSALYAQTDGGYYTREKVLEIFSQYNPSILEKAQQNNDYQSILEGFLSSYRKAQTPENRYELIAVARNFDNSLLLKIATAEYENALTYAAVGGGKTFPAQVRFRNRLTPLFANIWAVTVQLRTYELEECRAEQKALRKNKTLSAEERQRREAELAARISALKQELKRLQRNVGEQILSAADAYISETDRQFAAQAEAMRAKQEESLSEQISQADNLQIKTKNKKPVAK